MNTPTLLVRRQKLMGNDAYGQPILGPVTTERVCPVKLAFDAQHSTVRTDSSASRGHASELTANVVLLASTRSKIEIDEILTLVKTGEKLIVVFRHPRHRVTGQLDHFELRCTAWIS